ncbi:MAG: HD domain-containing protein [archaeon]
MRGVLSKNLERLLKRRIFPELEHGRRKFDVPHTKAVVKYGKLLSRKVNVSEKGRVLLMIACYCHDWGYSETFGDEKNSSDYSDVQAAKKSHAEIGARKTSELLSEKSFDFLSKSDKGKIVELVGTHDRLGMAKNLLGTLLFEADVLGAVWPEGKRPFYGVEANERFLKEEIGREGPLFKTATGKMLLEKLLRLRADYYAKKFGKNLEK